MPEADGIRAVLDHLHEWLVWMWLRPVPVLLGACFVLAAGLLLPRESLPRHLAYAIALSGLLLAGAAMVAAMIKGRLPPLLLF